MNVLLGTLSDWFAEVGSATTSFANSRMLDGSLQGREESSVVRLHVGGLGPAVISSDILQTFSSLVHVSSVDVVRTKDRSFAYVNIQAAPHDIKRLFSLYNGCMWKGGCLKLEKAREFYMDKLHREWAERDCPQVLNTSKPDSATRARIAPNLKRSRGLNMYFQRLRKVKHIPEKGFGKHKRSFERVEPLPNSLLRLCNCDQECMTTSNFQSLTKKLAVDTDSAIINKVMNEVISKSQLSRSESGKKGNKVFEGQQPSGGNERGVEKVPDLNDLINIKGGMPIAEIDNTEGTDNFDEPLLNITGLKCTVEREKSLEDQVLHKEESQGKVDRANRAQRKRRKVVHNPFPKKENKQHSETEKGTDQMLQGEDLIGSKFSRSLEGRSWVQKASWKSLVGGTGRMSFSLESVLEQR